MRAGRSWEGLKRTLLVHGDVDPGPGQNTGQMSSLCKDSTVMLSETDDIASTNTSGLCFCPFLHVEVACVVFSNIVKGQFCM